MDTFKVVHELIYELNHAYFCQVPMRFISNQSHGKDIRQGIDHQVWIFAGKQLKPTFKIIVCGHEKNQQ